MNKQIKQIEKTVTLNTKKLNKLKNRTMEKEVKTVVAPVPGRVTKNTTAASITTGRQREFVQSFNGTPSVFSNQLFAYLNIGNSVLFPRGSTMASLYTEFRWKYLKFEYETNSFSANATGASAGVVILATNYDASADAFSSYEDAAQYYGSVSGPAYVNITHDVKVKTKNGLGLDINKNYFIFNSENQALPTGVDNSIHDYNPGVFQLMTDNNAVNTNIGRLWVTYEAELIGPRTPLYTTPGGISVVYTGSSTTGNTFVSVTRNPASSTQIYAEVSGNTLVVTTNPSTPDHVLYVTVVQNCVTSISAPTTAAVSGNTALTPMFLLGDGTVSAGIAEASTDTSSNSVFVTSTTGIYNLTYTTGTIVGVCGMTLMLTLLPIAFNPSSESVEKRLSRELEETKRQVSQLTKLVKGITVPFDSDEELPKPPSSTPKIY